MKGLRGTWFDPFRHAADRKLEVSLIDWYEDILEQVPHVLEQGRADIAMTLVSAPMDIRGYGPVKERAVAEVKQKVADLLR